MAASVSINEICQKLLQELYNQSKEVDFNDASQLLAKFKVLTREKTLNPELLDNKCISILVDYSTKCHTEAQKCLSNLILNYAHLEQASTVVFDDIEQDLKHLQKQIESCQLCSSRVQGDHQEPFKSHMKEVFTKISKEYQDQRDNLQDCIHVFNETSEFFSWRSKTQQPIKEFFNCWIPFCRDFHSIFKNEILRKIKCELENVRAKVNADKKARTKDIKTSKANSSGLKAKLAKKGLLNNFLSNSFT